MANIQSICVYCGSSAGSDPAYRDAAQELGRAMAEEGLRLVYGGGSIGLMGILARSVLEHGGTVTGVIPQFLKEREVMLAAVPELIVTADMHERKRLMFDRADAFVALPGGIGTLEELVEMMTWAQLGRHKKPVVLADINGFWEPLRDLLDHMRRDGFIRAEADVTYQVAETAADVIPVLRGYAERDRDDAGLAIPISRL